MSHIFNEFYEFQSYPNSPQKQYSEVDKYFTKADYYQDDSQYHYKDKVYGIRLPSYEDLDNIDIFFPQTPINISPFFEEENRLQDPPTVSKPIAQSTVDEDIFENNQIDFTQSDEALLIEEKEQQPQVQVPIVVKKKSYYQKKVQVEKDDFKTKNIPKVFGNAFRVYFAKHSPFVATLCARFQVQAKDLNNYVKKLNFYSIKGMREAFQPSTSNSRQNTFKKIYRIMVNKFLREDTWSWFLANKRISNCRRLCNFRYYILRGLKFPASFVSWED